MNKPVKIAILAVVGLLVLGFIKDGIAQTVFTTALSKVTHVPVKVGSVHVSLFPTSIRIKNLKVYNPRGFRDKLMLDVPQIFIDFDLPRLFKGQAHFREVTLDLKEMVVVRDANGRLNVDAVKPTESQKAQVKKTEKEKKQGKAPGLLIDKLTLSVGRVVYKDYSAGPTPSVQTFDVNIRDRQYFHIDNPVSLVSTIMFETLTHTTLSRLAGLDLGSFKETGLNALSDGLGTGADVASKLLNIFQ